MQERSWIEYLEEVARNLQVMQNDNAVDIGPALDGIDHLKEQLQEQKKIEDREFARRCVQLANSY